MIIPLFISNVALWVSFPVLADYYSANAKFVGVLAVYSYSGGNGAVC